MPPERRPVRPEFVGDNHRRGKTWLLEQFPQSFQRGGLVAASLDQDIENLPSPSTARHIYIR